MFDAISADSSVLGILGQAHSEWRIPGAMNYRFWMPRDAKKTLWENVKALMEARYGKENLTRFAADVGVSPATADRLKKGATSVGLEIIEQIAETFAVEPWQLMVPGLNAKDLPKLTTLTEAAPSNDLIAAIRAAIRAESGPGLIKSPTDDREAPDSPNILSKQLTARRRAAAKTSRRQPPRKKGGV